MNHFPQAYLGTSVVIHPTMSWLDVWHTVAKMSIFFKTTSPMIPQHSPSISSVVHPRITYHAHVCHWQHPYKRPHAQIQGCICSGVPSSD